MVPITRKARFGLAVAVLSLHLLFARASTAAAPADTPEGLRLQGRVENGKGAPVGGAVVRTSDAKRSYSVMAEPDGSFSLALEGGRYWAGVITAASPDGDLQALVKVKGEDGDAAPPAALKVILKPARRFEVTVANGKGVPVPEARVVAGSDYVRVGEAATDSSGKAALRIPADAAPMFVYATKPGVGLDYVLFWRKDAPHTDPYRLEPDHARPLAFVLNGVKAVKVHATDDAGRPLAGVRVYPWYYEKPRKGDDLNISGFPEFSQSTDASGTASFQAPADVEKLVTFWAEVKGYTALERTVWDPKKGAAEVEARLAKLVHVAGRVLGADGNPAAGARVRVGGDGYQPDPFRGETLSAADGSFEIDVNPDQFYLFVADQGEQVSPPQMRVIKRSPPADRVELLLAPAVRVRGMVTAGPDRVPVPEAAVGVAHRDDGQTYINLPEAQRFPGVIAGRKSIMPAVYRNMKADKAGRFEALVGPGLGHQLNCYAGGAIAQASFATSADGKQYTLYHYPPGGDGQRTEETRDVPADRTIEVNVYFDRPPGERPRLLKGRVVLLDKPGVGVAEAKLSGDTVGKDLRFFDSTSGADGRFVVRRADSDLFLSAVTPDGKQRGIVVVSPDAETVDLPVGPMASALGLIVDHEGNLQPGRSVQFGVRVGRPDGPFSTMFGGYVETDAEGKFVINEGIVPGFEYELSVVTGYGDEGRPNGWMPVGKVKADRVERLELGRLALPKPYERKTWKQYVAEAFRRTRPFTERLDEARETAVLGYQHVLLILGAPGRPACQELYKLWYDQERRDVWAALVEYVPAALDVEAGDGGGRAWAEKAGVRWPQSGLTLAVLDMEGKLLAAAGEEQLQSGGAIDRAKLVTFAAAHAPVKPDARKLLDEALARAKREKKHVLLDESAPYCPPCVSLSKYLQRNRALISKDFVVVTLDRRFANGAEVMKRLRKDEVSTPWTAVLDADGKTLITSDAPGGNIGFPSDVSGRAHWEKMLRTGAWRLTEAEVQALLGQLDNRP